jgi:hypothetical protein
MAKAEITIPLDIPDVRVLQTSLNDRGEIIITIERNVASVENGSRNYTDEMNGLRSDTYPRLVVRAICGIDPIGINVSTVKDIRPPAKRWHGMMQTVHTVFPMTTTCCWS